MISMEQRVHAAKVKILLCLIIFLVLFVHNGFQFSGLFK